MQERSLTMRLAAPDARSAVRRLAELDSARTPRGNVLLAETDGAPVAAISLYTGAVVADPFQHSAEAVRLLRLRRYRLLRQGGDTGGARQLLRRLVPSPGG